MQQGTRIQTNDVTFANRFEQRCIGHDYDHAIVEGGKTVRDTAFYPKIVLSTRCSNLENQNEATPKKFLENLKKQE